MAFSWAKKLKFLHQLFANTVDAQRTPPIEALEEMKPIKEDDDDDKTIEDIMIPIEANKLDWSTLPVVALVEIFKFLQDVDRINAALVCDQWYQAFEAPTLWRYRTFELGGFKAQTNGDKAVKYAVRFGAHLRHLFINCSHPSFHTCRVFKRTLEEFFTTLNNVECQLLEFDLCRLELERYWKYDTPREKIVSIFSKFFRCQRRMYSFDMTSAKFPLFGGCRVLDSLALCSGSTIQDMLIEDFFHARLAVYQMKKFQKVIGKFTNLKYLSINYNCISEEILETFAKSLANNLEFINIKVFRNDPHMHRITGYTWKQLHIACPRMRVAFWFESIGAYEEMANIMIKEAPVKDVHIWTGYDDDSNWRLADTLTHIRETYTNNLECVSLEMDNTQEILDAEILGLITKCKRLKEFSLNALIGIECVQEICELQRERKIGLVYLHMTCCGLSHVEWAVLCTIKDRYAAEFRERRIDFDLTTDLLIDPDI